MLSRRLFCLPFLFLLLPAFAQQVNVRQAEAGIEGDLDFANVAGPLKVELRSAEELLVGGERSAGEELPVREERSAGEKLPVSAELRDVPDGQPKSWPAWFEAADSLEALWTLRRLVMDAREEGFLAAALDSFRVDSMAATAWVYAGPLFRWGRLSLDSIDKAVIGAAGIREKRFSGKPLNLERIRLVQEKLIRHYENHGYPFASCRVVPLRLDGDILEGYLAVSPNELFRIDTLHLKGDARIAPAYVERLSGIASGTVFSGERIAAFSRRIRETSFLEEIKPMELEYFMGKVDCYAYLKKSRANQFNGIIGVLPNNEQRGGVLLTGDLHLFLINAFGRGEFFRINWKSLQPLSQELDLRFGYPFLFNSAVGVALDFGLLKQDTSFISLNPQVDVRFHLGGQNHFHVYYDYFRSSLISTAAYEQAVSLPPNADVTSHLYGLGIRYQNLDHVYNPLKGWNIEGRAGLGSRRILANPALPEILYEDLSLNSTKFSGEWLIERYLRLASKLSLRLLNRSGCVHNEHLFDNELFRLGGIHTLRGIDEQVIYASAYSLGTLELRYLFERNSAAFLFFDGGYYEKQAAGDFEADFPYGFGAGVNLQTGAGIFSLNYAIGRQFGNPLNIGQAKIHIGYVNRF